MIMWQCKELRKREKSNIENCCHNRLFAVFAVTAFFNAYFVYWNRSRFPRREKWGLCIHYLGALEITLMKRTWVENLSVTHLETSMMLFTAYFRAHNILVVATFGESAPSQTKFSAMLVAAKKITTLPQFFTRDTAQAPIVMMKTVNLGNTGRFMLTTAMKQNTSGITLCMMG